MSAWTRTPASIGTRKHASLRWACSAKRPSTLPRATRVPAWPRTARCLPGERVPDFGESISKMLDIVKPVAIEATGTLKELQTTAQNLSRITDEYSQLNMALAQMRTFAENLTNMTARDSSISLAFKNIEKISTDMSSNDNIR